MYNVSIDKYKFQLPQNWGELTTATATCLAHALLTETSPYTVLTKWLYLIIGLQPQPKYRRITNDLEAEYYFKLGKKIVLINEHDLLRLAKLLQWIFKITPADTPDQPDVYQLQPKMVHNVLSVYNKLHGPANSLHNLKFDEYTQAEYHYHSYCHSNDPNQLHQLIATLWRKPVKNLTEKSATYQGDLREPFNSFLVKKNAEQVAKWPQHYQHTAFLFYTSCRTAIAHKYGHLFTYSKTNETNQNNESGYQNPAIASFNTNEDLAYIVAREFKKTIEDVNQMYMNEVLGIVNRLRQEAKALESQYAKH